MIKRICIVGVGLMGGSFGLALRRTRPDLDVIGVDSSVVLDEAIVREAITHRAESLEAGVQNADVIMLCAPVSSCVALLSQIAPCVKRDAIISDVGSVKLPLEDAAQEVLNDPTIFVGGHPMTGSENNGIRHAEEFLYENATYVLCPQFEVDHDTFKATHGHFIELISSVGGRVLLMTAAQHDRIAARISHLPQLLAIALVNSAGKSAAEDPEIMQLAAGGFRDMTRIASSSYSVWHDILASNSTLIQDAIDDLSTELNALSDYLESGDFQSIRKLFGDAESIRTSIPLKSKGFIQPLSDIYVFVSDKPGAIFDMAGRLSDERLNIKDIELLKIREGTGGTFRIGLESESEATDAARVLTTAGYRVHRL